MPFDLDLADWPVAVLSRAADDDAAVVGIDGAGPLLGSLLDRKERFGLVLDVGRQTESQQAEFGAWLHRNRVRAQRYVVGCALVVPTAAVARGRDLIGARPQLYPFPAWVASSLEECRSWVEGVLASSGPAGNRRAR